MQEYIRLALQDIVTNIQSGIKGPPSLKDLEVCAKIHMILERD